MTEDELNKQDEIVNVRLPRSEYEILRTLIQERETYRNVITTFKTHWIWAVGGGFLTLYTFWDKIHVIFAGVK
jgi:hypothetical protein